MLAQLKKSLELVNGDYELGVLTPACYKNIENDKYYLLLDNSYIYEIPSNIKIHGSGKYRYVDMKDFDDGNYINNLKKAYNTIKYYKWLEKFKLPRGNKIFKYSLDNDGAFMLLVYGKKNFKRIDVFTNQGLRKEKELREHDSNYPKEKMAKINEILTNYPNSHYYYLPYELDK